MSTIAEILSNPVNLLSKVLAFCFEHRFGKALRIEASVSMVRPNAKRGSAKVQCSSKGVWQVLISCRDGADGWDHLIEGILRLKLRAIDGKKTGRPSDADKLEAERALNSLFTPDQKAKFIDELGRMILPKGSKLGQVSYVLSIQDGKAPHSGRVSPSDKTLPNLAAWRKAATILGGSLAVQIGELTVDISNATTWSAVESAIAGATHGTKVSGKVSEAA